MNSLREIRNINNICIWIFTTGIFTMRILLVSNCLFLESYERQERRDRRDCALYALHRTFIIENLVKWKQISKSSVTYQNKYFCVDRLQQIYDKELQCFIHFSKGESSFARSWESSSDHASDAKKCIQCSPIHLIFLSGHSWSFHHSSYWNDSVNV